MKNQNGKKIIVIGDEENDVLAAESAGLKVLWRIGEIIIHL